MEQNLRYTEYLALTSDCSDKISIFFTRDGLENIETHTA